MNTDQKTLLVFSMSQAWSLYPLSSDNMHYRVGQQYFVANLVDFNQAPRQAL